MYSVSRYLIHDIFDELISQHYLIRVQGKGTFVRKPEQNRVALGVLNESKNASFTSLVRNFGIEISNKCLGTWKMTVVLKFFASLYHHHCLIKFYRQMIFGFHIIIKRYVLKIVIIDI